LLTVKSKRKNNVYELQHPRYDHRLLGKLCNRTTAIHTITQLVGEDDAINITNKFNEIASTLGKQDWVSIVFHKYVAKHVNVTQRAIELT
jgi:hypothetical protein